MLKMRYCMQKFVKVLLKSEDLNQVRGYGNVAEPGAISIAAPPRSSQAGKISPSTSADDISSFNNDASNDFYSCQVGAKALAAMQNGGTETQQQFVVYPTMNGIPMVVAADMSKVVSNDLVKNLS